MATERVTVRIKGLTCAACVARIEQALRQQEGVIWANVNFAAGQATLTYDPSLFGLKRLSKVIEGLGYELQADPQTKSDSTLPGHANRDGLAGGWLPVGIGILAALALIGLYLGLVTLAQGWQYATELLWRDRWLAGAIALSFGVQVGLYARVKALHHRGHCEAVTAAGTTTSSAAMLACCAHHVTDFLPILGLSAASAFLNQYRIPFALVGLGVNLAGIGLMLRLIRQMYVPGFGAPRQSGTKAIS